MRCCEITSQSEPEGGIENKELWLHGAGGKNSGMSSCGVTTTELAL